MQRRLVLCSVVHWMICTQLWETKGKLLHNAVHKEAVVGETVVIECKTDVTGPEHGVEWIHRPVDKGDFAIVYKEGHILNGYFGRMRVNENTTSSGIYHLNILKVDLYDAGSYSCTDMAGDRSKIELTVFEIRPSNETCAFSIPPDTEKGFITCRTQPLLLSLSCKMSYRGNTEPSLEWRSNIWSTEFPSNLTLDNAVTISRVDVTAYHTLQYSFSCQIKYRKFDLKSSYGWHPAPFTISPVLIETEIIMPTHFQEEIDCSKYANINHCNYTWREDTGKYISYGYVLGLNSIPEGAYKCTAKCQLRKDDTCTFVVAKTIHSRSGYVAIVSSVVVVGFLVIVCTIIVIVGGLFLYRRWKNKTGNYCDATKSSRNKRQQIVDDPRKEEQNKFANRGSDTDEPCRLLYTGDLDYYSKDCSSFNQPGLVSRSIHPSLTGSNPAVHAAVRFPRFTSSHSLPCRVVTQTEARLMPLRKTWP